jgi:hypothetical protein
MSAIDEAIGQRIIVKEVLLKSTMKKFLVFRKALLSGSANSTV